MASTSGTRCIQLSILSKIRNYVGSFGSDPDKVAQAAHTLAGALASVILGAVGAIVVVGPWGVYKEAVIDPAKPPRGENAPFFWNGAKDLLFYVLGACAGLLYHRLRFGSFWGI